MWSAESATNVAEIAIDVRMRGDGGAAVTWHWDDGGFQRSMGPTEVSALVERAQGLLDELWRKRPIDAALLEFGRQLGEVSVGAENAQTLKRVVASRRPHFTLCTISGHPLAVTAFPWEALHLPGSETPLLFEPEVRGSLDFARLLEAGPEPAGRRVMNKCLAAWSQSHSRDLLVEPEVDELRRRLLSRPGVKFRWVVNPDLSELAARLKLECALFLYSGHGKLKEGRYMIELDSRLVDVNELLPYMQGSRTEVVVFDSCESGYGHSTLGLPAVVRQIPSGTCLLGIQGPGNDIVSCWHMPAIIERLLLGQPVWLCVNLLRILLYDTRSDAWFLPVMHLKRCYRPFETQQDTQDYLQTLRRSLDGTPPTGTSG